ncbi:hypothetical protein [Halomonas sp.]|uniref:hypothetical protein n=1 Tax=Halomonas sp. TaxID=1486246 RepID=UPI003F92F872
MLGFAELHGPDPVWITRLSREQLEPYLQRLEGESPKTLPLYGIPFAIKDNIDLAGVYPPLRAARLTPTRPASMPLWCSS